MRIKVPNSITVSLSIILCLGSSAYSQQTCEPCSIRTEPLPKQGEYETPEVKIKWYSDADKYNEKNNEYYYERLVKNKHNKPLRFDWPLGRMASKALSPNGIARYCQTWGQYKSPASNGPFFYGRSNHYIDTQVWEAADEPPAPSWFTRLPRNGTAELAFQASSDVDVLLEIDLFFKEKTENIRLSLTSRAENESNNYKVSYGLRNLNQKETEYGFNWSFVTELGEFKAKLRELNLDTNVPYQIPQDSISFEIKIYHAPEVIAQILTIFFPNNDEAAVFVVPTYTFGRETTKK